MKRNTRNSVCDSLSKYCYFAKKDSYIEVTEWTNGEGYDVDLNGKQLIRLTAGELEAINYLVKTLELNLNDTECKTTKD